MKENEASKVAVDEDEKYDDDYEEDPVEEEDDDDEGYSEDQAELDTDRQKS